MIRRSRPSQGAGVFRYDGLGNIRQRAVGARTVGLSYNAANQLSAHTDTAPPANPDAASFASRGEALTGGATMQSGERLVSSGGVYSAALTNRGELLVYHRNEVIWRSNSAGAEGVYYLYPQGDCNLVIYTATFQPVWNSQTNCGGLPVSLIMQTDGNLVFYRADGSGIPIWNTGTWGNTGTDQTQVFAYDGHGRRVKSRLAGAWRYSVYDASGALVETEHLGGAKTDYIRASGMTLARVDQAGVTWLHHDHLGSAVAGTNAAGAVIWRESEQPFGEDWTSAAANDNQAGYTGHVEDAATGLTYMQARYYDPVIGRFLSIDPVGFSPGRPDMFNRYAYAANDPVNGIDPDGRSYQKCQAGGAIECQFNAPFALPDIGSQQLDGDKEHTKNARPSTKEKHEKGRARHKQDARGEKGDARRPYSKWGNRDKPGIETKQKGKEWKTKDPNKGPKVSQLLSRIPVLVLIVPIPPQTVIGELEEGGPVVTWGDVLSEQWKDANPQEEDETDLDYCPRDPYGLCT